jgi:hypothetical protein
MAFGTGVGTGGTEFGNWGFYTLLDLILLVVGIGCFI